ncbi:hypothetical protein PR202_gb16411 [Eleusine coracana subsp. coracana]|uniref:Xyloglucan 6-xylosyltransferase n=1 Tax=Eleusine coracana subsp. coracana TaxID=191504 RepID=A0AAV5F0E6_ELECO|nr:hypothetical protein PR202_gb16411 [Eleusine coracana subsp. coracana]
MAFELPLSRYEGKNLVIHGYPDLLDRRSWISLNAGIFLLRNCQWSLDLLDAWVQVGPKGPVRVEAGKMLTASLTGRPAFDADDQSALIHLLLEERDTWMGRVHVETEFYLHGFWTGLVGKYEEMMEKHHPGLGDDRWPFITHFVGCKTCGRYEDYPLDRCLTSMERAINFADNQVLRLYGFQHRSLTSPKVRRVTNRSENPLEAKEAALKLDARFDSPSAVRFFFLLLLLFLGRATLCSGEDPRMLMHWRRNGDDQLFVLVIRMIQFIYINYYCTTKRDVYNDSIGVTCYKHGFRAANRDRTQGYDSNNVIMN